MVTNNYNSHTPSSATPPQRNRTHHNHPFHYSPIPSHHHHHHHRHILPSTSILLIVIPVIITILLLFISSILIMLRRLKPPLPKPTHVDNNNSMFIAHTTITFASDVKGGCLYGTSGSSGEVKERGVGVQVFTYKELETATNNFSQTNVIGNGGFGVVYKGIFKDGSIAAIKILHRQGKQGERAFRLEVDLLTRLHSPYIVELVGYCADQNHRLLVFEYLPNGTLQQNIQTPQNQSQPLNWGTRLRIAFDCARALEYLHEHNVPSVIHRDFKCSNVLLDENFRAKVSDFGLAKIGSDKINGQISTRVLGTTGYLAPEYASTGKLTTKSDVYSYGVVLLELLTGRVPVDTKRPPGEHVLVSWALPRLTNRDKVIEMVDPALQSQFSKKDLVQIAAIAAMCVQTEADYRPLMTDVVQSLVPLVKNLSTTCPSSSFRFNQKVSPRC